MKQLEKSEAMNRERLDQYVKQAAAAAGYADFGREGCDLKKPIWWGAYIRQSLEEQAQNSRVPDYLRTCAQEAKKLGVVVPREYILYDAVTGEHLERPSMIRLRQLISERSIAGIIFPALDRLSREPLHQGIFEVEATHYGVRLHYADAPSGNDPGSQFARSILVHAAKLVKLANRKNARGGNIGRVLKGWVPASRAAYGYRYRADKEIGADGKVVVKKAWWETKELGPDGMPLWESPAWVVAQVYAWIGDEAKSLYWVANKLNQMGIKASEADKWSPAKVANLVQHRCYTGNHAYNVNARVKNPDRPLGDITAEVKRTLVRAKPKEEWVSFTVPALVSEELWQKANSSIAERGRGRGKQGRTIQALLRNRIFCPRCGKPMVVRRDSRQERIYYHCSKYFRPWTENPCNYTRFVPGNWDDLIWDLTCALLEDDAWLEVQLGSRQSQDESVAKLVRLSQYKITQAQGKIAKVQEGFEGGIYSLDEARRRIAEHEDAIARAAREIQRLQKETMNISGMATADIEAARQEMKALRDKNLNQATFEEKLDIIATLGIRVYPSEDLKSVKVTCGLNIPFKGSEECEDALECRKVMFGSQFWIKGKTRTFEKTFALVC
ncbi:MAG: recombinase family protein [Chloroflexota bacterium]